MEFEIKHKDYKVSMELKNQTDIERYHRNPEYFSEIISTHMITALGDLRAPPELQKIFNEINCFAQGKKRKLLEEFYKGE